MRQEGTDHGPTSYSRPSPLPALSWTPYDQRQSQARTAAMALPQPWSYLRSPPWHTLAARTCGRGRVQPARRHAARQPNRHRGADRPQVRHYRDLAALCGRTCSGRDPSDDAPPAPDGGRSGRLLVPRPKKQAAAGSRPDTVGGVGSRWSCVSVDRPTRFAIAYEPSEEEEAVPLVVAATRRTQDQRSVSWVSDGHQVYSRVITPDVRLAQAIKRRCKGRIIGITPWALWGPASACPCVIYDERLNGVLGDRRNGLMRKTMPVPKMRQPGMRGSHWRCLSAIGCSRSTPCKYRCPPQRMSGAIGRVAQPWRSVPLITSECGRIPCVIAIIKQSDYPQFG